MDSTSTTIIALVFLAALVAAIWFAVRNLRSAVDNVRGAIAQKRGIVPPEPEAVSDGRLSRISAERVSPGTSIDAPPPVTEADKQLVSSLLAGMTAQIEHMEDLDDMRGREACVVRLVPQIPIRDVGKARSWLGGRPRLPAGMDWPTGDDGAPLDFFAQICAADLPADIWDGLGPRSGWFAYFVHPEDGAPTLIHFEADGDPRDPPKPISDLYFTHHFAKAEQGVPLPRRAFPEWPVDLVVVRPGDPDPMPDPETGTFPDMHARYKAGYDLTDPALHPFDWPSMLALADILEGKTGYFWREVPEGASPLDDQLATAKMRLLDAEREAVRPDNLDALRAQVEFLPQLIAAAAEARDTNRAAKAQVAEIVSIIRETHSAGEAFEPRDAAAVIDALSTISWSKVNRKADPEKRPAMDLIEVKSLPLTRHDADATLWVSDYDRAHEDMAKHLYCENPDALPAATRAHYEAQWQIEMLRGMAGIGHIPFQYVHEFDPATEVMMLERPTCYLMNWIVGDCHNMVLTMKKDDLAAGNWDALIYQVSN